MRQDKQSFDPTIYGGGLNRKKNSGFSRESGSRTASTRFPNESDRSLSLTLDAGALRHPERLARVDQRGVEGWQWQWQWQCIRLRLDREEQRQYPATPFLALLTPFLDIRS